MTSAVNTSSQYSYKAKSKKGVDDKAPSAGMKGAKVERAREESDDSLCFFQSSLNKPLTTKGRLGDVSMNGSLRRA